jgi:hypothetical protein
MNRAGAKNLDLGQNLKQSSCAHSHGGPSAAECGFFLDTQCAFSLFDRGLRANEKDTVAAAKLSTIEIDEIINAVKQSAYDVPKSWRGELRFRRVDLGIGPGIVVQGTSLLCGGTGNCQMWVFRKAGAKWVSLFKNDQTILAEGFEFGPALKHHVKDLTVSTNFSADETRRVTYKFDGRRYTSR